MAQLIRDGAFEMNGKAEHPDFHAEVQRGGDASCISLRGVYGPLVPVRLDVEIEAVKRDSTRHLIIDLRGLTSVDADALQALLGDWAAERNDGLVLILVRVPQSMRPLLEQTGLAHQLPISYEGANLRRSQHA
jgi:anti-anti-sigma factor